MKFSYRAFDRTGSGAGADDANQLPRGRVKLHHRRTYKKFTRRCELFGAVLLRPLIDTYLGVHHCVAGVAEPQAIRVLRGLERQRDR